MREQIRVAYDGSEKIIEIVRYTAGETPHCFQFLGVTQFLLTFAQRFLGRAAFLDFADEIIALLKKLLHSAGQLAEFRIVLAHRFQQSGIVASLTLGVSAERPTDPADSRSRYQKQ